MTDAGQAPHPVKASLILTAVGVVYGDIGTSPIYTMNILFGKIGGLPVDAVNVYGALSLVFWALVLVVGFKYMLFVLGADNQGDGGVIALSTLLRRHARLRSRSVVLILGLIASALLIGDALLTPAISVLSAVQGLERVAPELTAWVPEITILVLILLFSIQYRGTGTVGRLFGPVMLIWFLVLAGTGLYWIIQYPQILLALDPRHALGFFQQNGWIGFVTLGTVFLAVTGSEALYADLGHFGARPIRLSWLFLVWPALVLNYLGQGALLLTSSAHPGNSFFGLVPGHWVIGLIIIATVAAVIASQAVISGVFSLFRQLSKLDYFPTLHIKHTSAAQTGQVYIATINWLLMAGVVLLVLGFRTADDLASAYGLAIGGVTLMTSILFLVFLRRVKRRHWTLVLLLGLIFLSVDLVFLGALATKLLSGAQVILLISAGVLLVMFTWHWGQARLSALQRCQSPLLADFIAMQPVRTAVRTPGSAVFLTRDPDTVPKSLLHNFRHNQVLHHETYILQILIEDVPRVRLDEKFEIRRLGAGFFVAVLRLGYMEPPRFETILHLLEASEYPASSKGPSLFLSRVRVGCSRLNLIQRWRAMLYTFMKRNTPSPAFVFGVPPEQLIEIGVQFELTRSRSPSCDDGEAAVA